MPLLLLRDEYTNVKDHGRIVQHVIERAIAPHFGQPRNNPTLTLSEGLVSSLSPQGVRHSGSGRMAFLRIAFCMF